MTQNDENENENENDENDASIGDFMKMMPPLAIITSSIFNYQVK